LRVPSSRVDTGAAAPMGRESQTAACPCLLSALERAICRCDSTIHRPPSSLLRFRPPATIKLAIARVWRCSRRWLDTARALPRLPAAGSHGMPAGARGKTVPPGPARVSGLLPPAPGIKYPQPWSRSARNQVQQMAYRRSSWVSSSPSFLGRPPRSGRPGPRTPGPSPPADSPNGVILGITGGDGVPQAGTTRLSPGRTR